MEKRIQDKVDAEAEKSRKEEREMKRIQKQRVKEERKIQRQKEQEERCMKKRIEETPETEARGMMSPTAEERQKEDSKADCRAAKQLYLSCLWYR